MNPTIGTFLAGFRSRWGALTAAACAGPLSLQLTTSGFVAPWPGHAVATGIATVVCAVGLLLAYQAFLRPAASHGRLSAAGLMLSAACLLTYLGSYSTLLLTKEAALTSHGQPEDMQAIRGFVRRPEIEASYPGDYPDRKLWEEFQYDVEPIWTASSILIARLGFLLTYIGFFFGLTFAVALLGAHRVRPRAKRTKRAA